MSHEKCFDLKLMGVFLLTLGIWGRVGGQPVTPQAPQIDLESLDQYQDKILFRPFQSCRPEEKWVTAATLSACDQGTGFPSDFPYDLHYEYEEAKLMTEREGCTLTLYLFPKSAVPLSEGAFPVWLYKFNIKVVGKFLDGPYELGVRLREAGSTQSGRIRLVAHQECPSSVLEVKANFTHTVPISGKMIDVALKNICGCKIKIQYAELQPLDGVFWKPRDIRILQDELAENSADYVDALRINLVPKGSDVIKKCLIPPGKLNPPSKVDVVIRYKILKEGQTAEIRKTLEINFSPPLAGLLASSFFGAILAFLMGIALADETPEAKRPASHKLRVAGVLKKAVFTVVIGLVVYVAYYLLRDNTSVAVLGFELDPEQVLPAVMIGFIVGLDPFAWYEKIKTIFNKQKGSIGGVIAPAPLAPAPKKTPGKSGVRKVRLMIAAALLASSWAFSGGSLFRPIMLAYQADANQLYTVSRSSTWGADSVYRLDPASINEPELLAELPPLGIATDHCLVERQGRIWLATVSSSQVVPEGGWGRSTLRSVSLVPLDGRDNPKEGMLKKQAKGIGLYFAVTYDAHQDRLLLSDPLRQAVYGIKILDGRLSDEELVHRDIRWQRPACLMWSGDILFLADAGTCEVYKIDLATHEMSVVATDVKNPTALAISSDGRLLYAGDADRGVVFEINLMTGARRERIRHPELITPNGVAIDPQGNIWVADSKAMAVFQFASDGRWIKTVRPQVAP